MDAIKIFTVLSKPSFKNSYYMKTDSKPAKKISIDRYFNLYDNSKHDKTIIVLPPLTIE